MTRLRTAVHGPLAAVAALVTICLLAGCGGAKAHSSHSSHSATTAGATGTPSATSRVVYGLSDAPGLFAQCTPTDPSCCPAGHAKCTKAGLQGYYDNPLFLKLTSPASAHRIRDVRLFVPYDAVSAWNGSTTRPGCTTSKIDAHAFKAPAGYVVPRGEAISQLIAGLTQARADGLTPLVTITGYPQLFDRPPGDVPMPDPTTIGGSSAFRCGLRGILGALSHLPAPDQPHVWEPLNEPETFPVFNGSGAAPATECKVSARPEPDGPAKAACAQAVADRIIHATAGHGADTVIAGDFQHPYASYLAPFVSELQRQLPGHAFPATWSVHAYHEVSEGYTGARPTDVAGFDAALARDTHGRARSLWITEAASVLTSTYPGGGCPKAGVDAARTLGACLNGQPRRQAASVSVFFALPHVAHAVPITHLFWYQLIGGAGWDSGLLDAAGAPRPVFCTFFGSGHCTGSPNAA